MSDPLADFAADHDGLRAALDHLLAATARPGEPHPRPEVDLGPDLPLDGIGGREALERLAPLALDGSARLDHPGFAAHMDPPTPWFTWAAAQWAAATNQNLLHPDVAPAMRELERTVISWLAPVFGMAGGHLVPGSTVSTITALWAARDVGGAREVVSSSAAHVSVAKAARLLGMRHRVIPVDHRQRLDLDRLDPVDQAAVVLTAGTVAAGAVDPLAVDLDARWVHVDAAWAGPLRFSSTHRAVLDGMERADSVGFSAHKWLHQPKDSAAILFRDPEQADGALSFGGSYLSAPNVGLLGSSGARALPLAATLLAWGQRGVGEVVDAGMAVISGLHDALGPRFDVWGPNETGVLLWRPSDVDDAELLAVRDRMRGVWVSTADVDDRVWFRSVGANPRADVDRIVAEAERAIA